MAECCEVIGDAGINILAGAGISSDSAAVVIVTDDAEGQRRLSIQSVFHLPCDHLKPQYCITLQVRWVSLPGVWQRMN